ncbi:hypothetical protein Hanom_Chr05g00473311 [Helianthus anomalus]
MALTWATGVRFGRTTRRNERENELHLAANAYGSMGHHPGRKTLISISYLHFYVFWAIWAFCFRPCVWPVIFFRPISNFSFYLYVPLVI